jgi:predicted lipid-binding transport protein (Tim44 family)
MKKQFNFGLFKQKMFDRVKSSYYDVCTDYFKEIKVNANNEDLDQVEMLAISIRQMELCSVEQENKIAHATCLMDILEITLFNDTVGNIFYEDEDTIIDIMGKCYTEEVAWDLGTK